MVESAVALVGQSAALLLAQPAGGLEELPEPSVRVLAHRHAHGCLGTPLGVSFSQRDGEQGTRTLNKVADVRPHGRPRHKAGTGNGHGLKKLPELVADGTGRLENGRHELDHAPVHER